MIVKLLTEHHLEFLSLKGGCRGSSESTHVKKSHCWKSHSLAHFIITSAINQLVCPTKSEFSGYIKGLGKIGTCFSSNKVEFYHYFAVNVFLYAAIITSQ